MIHNPATQPVTVEVDLRVGTNKQRTPALLSNATGDVSPGQLVLATDGDEVLPAIVDQIDATAGTMLLSVRVNPAVLVDSDCDSPPEAAVDGGCGHVGDKSWSRQCLRRSSQNGLTA